MNLDRLPIQNQRYSRPLRIVAALIAGRESDAACIAQLQIFLERSGVPVEPLPELWYTEKNEETT